MMTRAPSPEAAPNREPVREQLTNEIRKLCDWFEGDPQHEADIQVLERALAVLKDGQVDFYRRGLDRELALHGLKNRGSAERRGFVSALNEDPSTLE